MMKCYFVDAFAEKVFEGNPAGVCVVEQWLDDEMMRLIAMENNLSETAFTMKAGDTYQLRWFTPEGEIDLCGHATLATAFVLAHFVEPNRTEFSFDTLSGRLTVVRKGDLYEMDFPSYELMKTDVTDEMEEALGIRPLEAYKARDLVCVFGREEDIYTMKPDQQKVKALHGVTVNVTAKGTKFDCISRTFAPKCNVAEDPVCGSGHCHIIPYWAARLNQTELIARQASKRGGTLYCQYCGERTKLSGRAVLYAISELQIDPTNP